MHNKTDIKLRLIERDGLKCAVTGKSVTTANELSIEHIIPASKGGTDNLDNLMLVSHDVNVAIGDDERRRTKLLLQELKDRQDELANREAETFEREKTYRLQLEEEQRALDHSRARLRVEQAEREHRLQAELEDQKKRLYEQQLQFQTQFSENEKGLNDRLVKLEEQRRSLAQELQQREERLQLAFQELEHEKQKYTEESRKKIESNSAAYVNEALLALGESATRYHGISRNWSLTGLASLLFGVTAAGYFGLSGFTSGAETENMNWARAAFFGFKGVIIVGLFVAIAKYCFSYSQSFMHESLKNSERKHAINFGKFYLQSYGANAEWTQVREAFEHWNIAPPSAFSKNDSDKFDPKIVERAAQLIDSVGKIRLLRDPAPEENKKT